MKKRGSWKVCWRALHRSCETVQCAKEPRLMVTVLVIISITYNCSRPLGKDRWVKTCLLENPSGELPHHADAHAQLHSACCCQPDDILLWKNTLKSWHEMIRFLLDFRLVASTVHSKVLKSSMRMWLNVVRRWWGQSIPRWKTRELRGQTCPKTVSHQRKLN